MGQEIQIGQHISLWDLNIIVVSLVGHTKGSIGFFVQEEEILIAGDALNEGLWLFNYGSLSMMDLYQTIKATTGLDFSTYLCGHSNEEYHKEKLFSHMKNIENLKIDSSTKQNTIQLDLKLIAVNMKTLMENRRLYLQ